MKLLIATGESVASADDLPAGVRALIEAADEVFIVTPALPGRLQWLASDTDEARQQADERLDSVLGQIEELDVPAAGDVVDDSPMTAIEEAVARSEPDHILVGLRASDHSGWQERGLTEAVRERFHLPLTIFEIDAGGEVPEPG